MHTESPKNIHLTEEHNFMMLTKYSQDILNLKEMDEGFYKSSHKIKV